MRGGVVTVTLAVLALSLSAFGAASTTTNKASHALSPKSPAGYVLYSTQAVCALTGNHGAYVEQPTNYTQKQFGMSAGDSGSSFEYDGQVWWLFGNSDASQNGSFGSNNVNTRWPKDLKAPLNSAVGLGSDAMAYSSESAPAPVRATPYSNSQVPPDQQCPRLHFVTEDSTLTGPYVNPSVYPDPMFPGADDYVSLRRGELPESGIAEDNSMYVVFGTDNPANCDPTMMAGAAGACQSLANNVPSTTVCPNVNKQKGSRTRSVMAVYEKNGQFKGLWDLSAPDTRYTPSCITPPTEVDARFVNVQMQNGTDGFVYFWGTEGGANDTMSPVYLARLPVAQIASGVGITYWNGSAFVAGPTKDPQSIAAPLWTDTPNSCASQLGVQYNQYLNEWIVLYQCNESPSSAATPNGIFMRTAKLPQGPWSAPTTVFNPTTDEGTHSGFCYFIYRHSGCPKALLKIDASLRHGQSGANGGYYGPYFVANWTTGTAGSTTTQATTTIYYTLDTYDPYGQLIMRSTINGPAPQSAGTCSTC
jgi:hypothetical protein